jgi:hypothetical protein
MPCAFVPMPTERSHRCRRYVRRSVSLWHYPWICSIGRSTWCKLLVHECHRSSRSEVDRRCSNTLARSTRRLSCRRCWRLNFSRDKYFYFYTADKSCGLTVAWDHLSRADGFRKELLTVGKIVPAYVNFCWLCLFSMLSIFLLRSYPRQAVDSDCILNNAVRNATIVGYLSRGALQPAASL